MRLHRALVVGLVLCGGIASAQEGDQPKTSDAARAKKDAMPHAPLFLEQKDAPTLSKTATPNLPRVAAKQKD